MKKVDETLVWLFNEIKKRISSKFYGQLTIKFEAGRIVHLEARESIRPPGNGKTSKTS